ncbi:MAG: type II toxin-antitoxin system mRNA interferase toxin, RelE/StbE family [Patescibacteria group bacterium]
MNIIYSPEFARRFKKLPREIKLKALVKEKIFRKDPFDPRLKTHKLSGKLADEYAFWVDFKTRIIFSFVNSNLTCFHSVGGHEIYK